jgi:hypothetical protein
LLPFAIHDELINAYKEPVATERLKKMKAIIMSLPAVNIKSLSYLVGFMQKMISNTEVNKMTSQSLSIVMAPNILYTKNNDPTSPNYFDTVMSEGQTFTFILDQSPHIFPSFDVPAFILPKDQRVPLGAGKLVENEKSAKVKGAKKESSEKDSSASNKPDDGAEDDDKKKKSLFGLFKGKKEDEKGKKEDEKDTNEKDRRRGSAVRTAPPGGATATSTSQATKQQSSPQITSVSTPKIESTPRIESTAPKSDAQAAAKKVPALPPKPVLKKASEASVPDPSFESNVGSSPLSDRSENETVPVIGIDDFGSEFNAYDPELDSQFQ